MSKLSLKALEIAYMQKNIQEATKGCNCGVAVNGYLASVGLGPGYAWCAAFVYWCVNQAVSIEPSAMGKSQLKRTAGALDMYNGSTMIRVTQPQRGDIFIMDFGKGLGHAGFVTNVIGTNVYTLEGNSNDEGSREGYEVCERVRPISSMKGFLRV